MIAERPRESTTVYFRRIRENIAKLNAITKAAAKAGFQVTVSNNSARCTIEVHKSENGHKKTIGTLLGATVDEALDQIRFASWLIPILYPNATRRTHYPNQRFGPAQPTNRG